MLKNVFLLLLLLSASASSLLGQNQNSKQKIYGIVIKGGYVIDPKNNINELMDIVIQAASANQQGQLSLEPRIALIAKNIDTALAIQVVDAKGMYVTPGFIDIHTHVFYGPSKSDYLGNGSIADIAVISMREGDFGFRDIVGNRQKGNRCFECQLTI